jgi:DNA (cytosine-5)-methyltransferase 1
MERISYNNLADLLGVSRATLKSWETKGVCVPECDADGRKFYFVNKLDLPEVKQMLMSTWNEEKECLPHRPFTSIELFAGAGGLALGMAQSGFNHLLLNEWDSDACATLRLNRPDWNVVQEDVHNVDFTEYKGKVDLLTGGFPCQAFSYAGKQGGFNDTRGTLFFELARAVKEVQPAVFVAENVKGLLNHDSGKTFNTICNAIKELGYTLLAYKVMRAIMYAVPQKRERLILVAVRNDIAPYAEFIWPSPYYRVLTLRDAFCKGVLYNEDVPYSAGQQYPEKKRKVMDLVPMGGDWRDLPVDIQKEYMGGSFYLGGGRTGMARRLSLDEPSLTLTCAPAQKQTERCHPIETRPLSIREYARIQTFPDEWKFSGNLSSQYKQIGNAVPVNLAAAVGRSIIRMLNGLVAKGKL